MYYPIIDTELSEVDRRFGGSNRNVMCGIRSLTPGSGQFLEYSSIKKFAEQYKSNVGELALELKQMNRMVERKTADNTMSVFGENTSTLLDFCNFISIYDDAVMRTRAHNFSLPPKDDRNFLSRNLFRNIY